MAALRGRTLRPWHWHAETDPAYTVRRCFVWSLSGSNVVPVAPSAGGDIDGVLSDGDDFGPGPAPVTGPERLDGAGYVACAGMPVKVEASASFSAGASLETDTAGKVKAVASGKAVLRALEASTADGDIISAVFTSGR